MNIGNIGDLVCIVTSCYIRVTPCISGRRSPVTLLETSSRHGRDANLYCVKRWQKFVPGDQHGNCQGYVFRIGGGNDKQVVWAVRCPTNADKRG